MTRAGGGLKYGMQAEFLSLIYCVGYYNPGGGGGGGGRLILGTFRQ